MNSKRRFRPYSVKVVSKPVIIRLCDVLACVRVRRPTTPKGTFTVRICWDFSHLDDFAVAVCVAFWPRATTEKPPTLPAASSDASLLRTGLYLHAGFHVGQLAACHHQPTELKPGRRVGGWPTPPTRRMRFIRTGCASASANTGYSRKPTRNMDRAWSARTLFAGGILTVALRRSTVRCSSAWSRSPSTNISTSLTLTGRNIF